MPKYFLIELFFRKIAAFPTEQEAYRGLVDPLLCGKDNHPPAVDGESLYGLPDGGLELGDAAIGLAAASGVCYSGKARYLRGCGPRSPGHDRLRRADRGNPAENWWGWVDLPWLRRAGDARW